MGAIYLIRHGQASFGAVDYDKLSKRGVEQAAVLGQALAARGVKPDVVICGGMLRHRETALGCLQAMGLDRSEEHTSELQSLMRISYAVFCLKKKKKLTNRECNSPKAHQSINNTKD